MKSDSAIRFIENQIVFYDRFLSDIENEKKELNHKLELAQQRYEIYKEKQNDYRLILEKLVLDTD